MWRERFLPLFAVTRSTPGAGVVRCRGVARRTGFGILLIGLDETATGTARTDRHPACRQHREQRTRDDDGGYGNEQAERKCDANPTVQIRDRRERPRVRWDEPVQYGQPGQC